MQIYTVENLVTEIQNRSGQNPIVIAISGFGGSGKSTLAQKLHESLDKSTVIHLDDFIVDQLSSRSADWDGFDWERLKRQVLEPLQEGKKQVEYDVYDWPSNKLASKKKVDIEKYVIIEGVGLIRDELKQYFDCTIWIDIPLEIASERGRTRDREEYKVPHDNLWDELWTPNDRDYFEKYQPNKNVDFCFKQIEK